MAVWERERVLELSSHAPSRLAAAALATPLRWTSLGANEQAVWGRCQGSARTPYETVVEVGAEVGTEPAYACSCPSRRSPCKHVLGLLLLWSGGGVSTTATVADFAAAWLHQRDQHVVGSSASRLDAAGVPDPEAAARRVEARAERIRSGLDDLDLWLRDQIRGGLAGLERAGYPHFDRVAARMVDAQAPGVAGVLRAIAAELTGEGWPERVLERLAGVHLLIQAHRRLADLPPELAANVRSRVGYPVPKSDELAFPGVTDRWLALGMVDTLESQLQARRVWLYGTHTGRWALWLSFAAPGMGLDATVLPGQQLDARVHFYPGSSFRVLIGDLSPDSAGEPDAVAAASFAEVRQRFALLLAVDPWATRLPAVVAAAPLPPAEPGQPWRLRDPDGHCVAVTGLAAEPWPLLARSGGEPIELFGEWSATGLRPLSVLADRDGPFSTDFGT